MVRNPNETDYIRGSVTYKNHPEMEHKQRENISVFKSVTCQITCLQLKTNVLGLVGNAESRQL